jgi:YD repeat-containing protein
MGSTGRRLMFHGMVLFLLGLGTGFAEQHFANVRMGLAAHLEGLMNGIFLLALGRPGRKYDANGNVSTRTDARSIVTHYTYDALNRLLGKTYTNDPANTPTLTYGYDIEYPFQIVQDEDNPVGHLNSIMATLGTTNLVTWTSTDYDQRGNLTGYQLPGIECPELSGVRRGDAPRVRSQ